MKNLNSEHQNDDLQQSNPLLQEPAVQQEDNAQLNQQKFNNTSVIAIVLALIIVGAVGYWYGTTKNSPASKEVSTIQDSITTTNSTSTPTPKPTTTQSLEQTNLISYTLPQGWQEKKVMLTEGQEYTEYPQQFTAVNVDGETSQATMNLVNVTGPTGGAELTILSKNKYHIQIIAQKNLERECGGISALDSYPWNLQESKVLTILNVTAARPNLENGGTWMIPDAPETLPISEPIVTVADPKDVNGMKVYDMPFCIEDTKNGVRLTIDYLSPTFITPNFNYEAKTSKNIDSAIIREMDVIVESIKLM